MQPLIDAHLDLAWNAMSFDRDQTQTIEQIRKSEAKLTGKSRGCNTVSLPEMRKARVGVCLATVLARAIPAHAPAVSGKDTPLLVRRGHGEVILREDLDHANQTIACAAAQSQLAYYRLLEEQGQLRQIRTSSDLDAVWSQWQQAGDAVAQLPIGFILSMEGTDPIITPQHAQWWWQQGLRTACLAHYGPSAHAMGTGGDGPLTDVGRQLLREFAKLGMILDLVHTADTAFDQALELFDGPAFVSHGNCRSLRSGDRQISDAQIKRIAERGGVIGLVVDGWMLDERWSHDKPNKSISLAVVADHIDHICQVTGSVDHAGFGTDLDGGFGAEQCPHELDTIADMQKLEAILARRGYAADAVAAIFHGNWLRFFRKHLPA